MTALQGRVNRLGTLTADPAQLAIDSVCRDVSHVLRPLLVESLHPRTFTGKVGLSINFQAGSVRHIKTLDGEEQTPGVQRPPASEPAGGDNVLESVLADLRGKLPAMLAGASGSLTLTIEVAVGYCRKVTWDRERFFKNGA